MPVCTCTEFIITRKQFPIPASSKTSTVCTKITFPRGLLVFRTQIPAFSFQLLYYSKDYLKAWPSHANTDNYQLSSALLLCP